MTEQRNHGQREKKKSRGWDFLNVQHSCKATPISQIFWTPEGGSLLKSQPNPCPLGISSIRQPSACLEKEESAERGQDGARSGLGERDLEKARGKLATAFLVAGSDKELQQESLLFVCLLCFPAVYDILKLERRFGLLHFSASAASVSENGTQRGTTGIRCEMRIRISH